MNMQSRQNQNSIVPLDYNNLGGANQDNNYNQPYNKMNSMSGYPRGSYINEMNNINNMNNNINQNQQNFANTYNMGNRNYTPNPNQGMNGQNSFNNSFRSPSPRQIRMEELEKKKTLLNNIQSQINLTRQNKMEQMNKNKEEDAKYLRDMMVYYPFGKGGGGAPIRDKSGNIVTNRRSLISDPKYNLASINVDDDYYEVYDKEKRIGRYYNYGNNNVNNNNNNYNQQLSNTGNNFRGMNYNNNNKNMQDPYSNQNQNFYNNDNFQQMNNGRPYSTNPRYMNNNNMNNYNYNNPPNMDYYPEQQNNNYQMQDNIAQNPQYFNTLQRPNTKTISLTYDNYEVNNNEQQMQIKENYRQDLLRQIKENEEKKEREKRRKKEEEEKLEEKLRKEREELFLREQEEKNKNKQLLNKLQNDNNLLIQEKNKNSSSEFINLRPNRKVILNKAQSENNLVDLDKEAFEKIQQKELESKLQLNNEIMNLREQMKEQQNDLFHQIAFLKQETQNANQQRFEALKEIDKLKDELSKQRNDEILRRKYVYDVVVNDAKNANNIVQESHLPNNEKPNVVLPVDSEKDIYYEEKIRHPNRVIPVPKLTELNEHGVKSDSKFIDIDTHNLIGGLELYQPNEKLITSTDEDYKINNRGIGIEGDYGTLRGNDNIMRTSDVLMPNSTELNTNQVNISINNKKMQTFKNIKNVETVKDERNDNININLESIDDSGFEVNKIYNKNLERLRYLNDMENNFTPTKNYDLLKNNALEKDNFDEFIKKLNRPMPFIPKEKDEEFEIEISKVQK